MNLGSLADSRLNEPCTHPHPHPQHRPEMPPIELGSSAACSGSECGKKPSSSCNHCTTSLCRKHLEEKLCTSEHLPAADVIGEGFICPACRPAVDARCHTKAGCATCDELTFFKEDLLKCAQRTECQDMIAQAKLLCQSINIMIGHNARIVNQERGCLGQDATR